MSTPIATPAYCHRHQPAASRCGSALVSTTIIVVLLASIATVLTETTLSGFQQEVRRTQELQLAMAAESGANIALNYLQSQPDLLGMDLSAPDKLATLPSLADVEAGRASTDISGALDITTVSGMPLAARWCYMGQRAVRRTFVDGLPRLEVVPIGTADSMTQDVYYLRASATYGSEVDANTWRTRRVELLFVPYPQNVFLRAMFARRGYDFQGAATTDSWDSSTGSYSDPASVKGSNGDLGSEGDIYVQKPENVKGEINDFISYPLPPIVFNDAVPYLIPSALTTTMILSTGTYHASYVKLAAPHKLTISGRVTLYVDGPVDLAAGGGHNPIVYADANSKLTLIQNDYDPNAAEWIATGTDTEISMNGNDVAGSADDPSQFLWMSSYSGLATFNGNGIFGGTLYFPNATMKYNGTFDFYGSVIADTFATQVLADDQQGRINGTFSFHYDEQLGNLMLPLPPRIGVIGWYTTNPRVGGP